MRNSILPILTVFHVLSSFGQSYISSFSLETQLPGVNQSALGCYKSADGKVWIKTKESVFYFENNVLHELNSINSCVSMSVPNALFPFAELNGELYCSMGNNGIIKLSPSCEIFSSQNGNFPQCNVRDLVPFNSALYFGNTTGLQFFDGVNFGIENTGNSPLWSDTINSLCVSGGKLYIFHKDKISVKTGNTWEFIDILPYTADNKSHAVYYAGELFIVLSGEVFMYYANQLIKPEHHFPSHYMGKLDRVYSLLESPDGMLYSVNESHLFNTITGETYPLLGISQSSLIGNSFMPTFSGTGELFFSSDRTLYRVNLNQYTPYPFDSLYHYSNFLNTAYLNINKVSASINSGGSQFYSPKGFADYKINGKNTLYSNALWITGKDTQTGEYKLSAEPNKTTGRDFFPGPLNPAGEFDFGVSMWFDRVWKVNRFDIENFIYNQQNGNTASGYYNIPLDILEWPGNPIMPGMTHAPFVDVDNDQIYNPLNGDYPSIKGDQMIWWIFNDMAPYTRKSGGVPMGIEVECMAYAFENNSAAGMDTLVNSTTVIEYFIKNKSTHIYDSVFIGNFSDLDIGYRANDYFGSCVNSHAYYGYDSDFSDIGGVDLEKIIQLVILLEDGIHVPQQRELAGVTAHTSGSLSELGAPSSPSGYENMLRKPSFRAGEPLQYGLWGFPFQGSIPATHAFPGNSDPNFISTSGINPGFSWTAITPYPGNPPLAPHDTRGLGRTGPYTFLPGEVIHTAWAFTTIEDFDEPSHLAFILGDLCSIPTLIQSWYENNSFPSDLDLSTLSNNYPSENRTNWIYLFPNPGDDQIQIITYGLEGYKKISVITPEGKMVKYINHYGENTIQLDVSELSSGVYFINVSDREGKTHQSTWVKK
jgi:hypothetical protein